MTETRRKIVVIGAGIAGLCAGVYARKFGYDVEIVEQHDGPGGLATSWRRGDYTFETCLHWLIGANPEGMMHAQWREVFDVDTLTFVHPEEFVRIATEHGETLRVYSDIDRMEAELSAAGAARYRRDKAFHLGASPLDQVPAARPHRALAAQGLALLQALPLLPLLRTLSKLSVDDYGKRFSHKLLRAFFDDDTSGRLSLLALVFALVWMSQRNAAYVVGGSQAIIRAIRTRTRTIGRPPAAWSEGRKNPRCEQRCGRLIQLANGETITADWVISAADGHATIYDMLGGRFVDETIENTFRTLEPFPSYLQVSLGIAREFSHQAGHLTLVLDAPLALDPDRVARDRVPLLSFRSDFAPPGKTAVTCFLPTRNFAYWTELQRHDPELYQAEKRRVADAVISILERMVPDVRNSIEVTDVSTPATIIRYTGNWQGSMEGWLMTPATGFKMLRNTLPGLRQFLDGGPMDFAGRRIALRAVTARAAVRKLLQARSGAVLRP